jgi:glycosyltransferase involved in cell wall biosynthesis
MFAEKKVGNNPKVCVCIPSYNSSATIAETITSLQQQTYKNISIIVVDNASTDATLDISKKFASDDPRIEIRAHDVNIGGEGNFSRCIQISQGDYTAIFHADDVYCPTIIEEQINLFSKSQDIGAIFTGAYTIDMRSKICGKTGILPPILRRMNKSVFNFHEILSAVARYSNFFVFPSAMVRTNVYKNEIVAWNAHAYRTSADLDVWLRIAAKHSIGYIEKPLMKYRTSSASYSYRIKYARTSYFDFFLVMDKYINAHKDLLTNADLRGYNLLKKKDAILRARNLLISGKLHEARILANKSITSSLITSSRSFDDCTHIAIGLATVVLSYFSFGSKFFSLLHKAKNIVTGNT